ncbi:urease accessory protein UreE [Vibrio misgurnus]|uniref:urease accessory protein UreE n=1 Tax=Vibrio TaxID=662 RepID=UPI002417C30F|nr:urease accessory protein UreE [Vibrio sp. gvc]
MLKVIGRSDHCHSAVLDKVVLPYALRQKGRFRAVSQSGLEVGVFLPRGALLKQGDYLHTECGQVLQVVAQQESVILAKSDDWQTFAKVCYHMGNRHVPMEIGDRWLRFQPDHVLQQMVSMMGLVCEPQLAEFNPEHGAYHTSSKPHFHPVHEHAHSHSHEQDHAHHSSHAQQERGHHH